MRVTTQRNGEHHEAIPNHHPIKTGTLSGILKSIAAHHRLTVEELIRQLGFLAAIPTARACATPRPE